MMTERTVELGLRRWLAPGQTFSSVCARRSWTSFDHALAGCTCARSSLFRSDTGRPTTHREALGRDRDRAGLDGSANHFMNSLSHRRQREKLPSSSGPTVGSHRLNASQQRSARTDRPSRMPRTRSARAASDISEQRTSLGSSASCETTAVRHQPAPKHLRVLGACLQAAIYYKLADSNPVRELPPAQRPRPERKEAAYFENDELPRLFRQLTQEPYRTLCLVALKTGMRQGELIALRWFDVDLEQAVIRVRRNYTGGHLGTPKNRERRDVDLITEVVTLMRQLGSQQITDDRKVWSSRIRTRASSRQPSCSRGSSTPQCSRRDSNASGQPRKSAPSIASDTHSPNALLRVGHKSPGSHDTSVTPHSK